MKKQNPTPEKTTSSLDGRDYKRTPHKTKVTLRPLDDPMPGISDNVSDEGIMFYTQEDLRVSIEIAGPNGPVSRTGRVVRVNRIGTFETGMAVEFDPE